MKLKTKTQIIKTRKSLLYEEREVFHNKKFLIRKCYPLNQKLLSTHYEIKKLVIKTFDDVIVERVDTFEEALLKINFRKIPKALTPHKKIINGRVMEWVGIGYIDITDKTKLSA